MNPFAGWGYVPERFIIEVTNGANNLSKGSLHVRIIDN